MKVLNAIIVGLIALTFIGCASKSELEEVRTIAKQAKNTAAGAVQCCEQAHEKIDRMYVKVMTK